MFCPRCNNEVKTPGARFCPDCGGVLAIPAVTACPRCGFAARQGSKFCGKCGLSLEASSDISRSAMQDEAREIYAAGCQPGLKGSAKRSGAAQTSGFFSSKRVILLVMVLVAAAALGGIAYAFLWGYVMDRESPEVTITSPAGDKAITLGTSGGTAGDVIEIKAKDRKLEKVDLLVNGVPVKSYNHFDSMIFNWEADKEGKYTFYAVARDYCGNMGKSPPLVIEVKNPVAPPAVMTANYPNQEKQVIEAFSYNWIKTITERKINEHMDCYADNLDIYYKASNVPKSDILKSRQEMFNTYSKINMSIYNLQVNLESNNSATAIFNKKWDCSGKETFSGEVLQKLSLKNFNGKWQIIGEEEIKVLWAVKNGKTIE
ncbi:MAG: Double zinc ribbon [Pelotomaculum sp. PtaU1.Bin035]|nr:MAG: Double zinc ribbon [Pelotomaculum sp. PtaU1.Bin035]